MAKGAGRKSTKVKGAKNAEAGAEGVVVGLPENDPIVVDNPDLRIDLVNVEGLPGGGPKKPELQRKFRSISQLVVFDSDGEKEWRVIELDEDEPIQIVLDDGERLIFEPSKKNKKIRIRSSKTSQFFQDDFTPSQFSLDVNPKRRIAAFVCKGKDLSPPKQTYDGIKEVPLSEKGRHVVMLNPDPKRFGAVQLL